MKFSIQQETLKRGIATVMGAVYTRASLPVLSNVYIGTDEGRLKLSATNLELSISCYLGARVETNGSTTVPAKLLAQFIGNLPSEMVTAELVGRTETLNLKCAGMKGGIKGINSQEFPIVTVPRDTKGVIMDAQALRTMIDQVVYAVNPKEGRTALTGALVTISNGVLTMVGADGYRLAKSSAKVQSDLSASAIVPAQALREVAKIIGNTADGAVQVTIQPDNRVSFCLQDIDIMSQIIDGAYPDWPQLVPPSHATRLRIGVDALSQAVRTAGLFADSKNIVRLGIEADGKLTVSASSAETGSGESELQGALEGDPITIALSCPYLSDALASMPDGDIDLEMNKPHTPMVIRPAGNTDMFALVMPMHLSEGKQDA